MGASTFEYRFRYPLHALIYILGLWPFWEPWLGLTAKSTWLTASIFFFREGWLNFQAATVLLLMIGFVFAALGALFRVWGTAYLGEGVVSSPSMHSHVLLADGPYRRTRNPLYLGTLLHTIALALLMPPAGAVLAIAGIWVLQVRLALAEEPFLTQRFGQAYLAYAERVPRFLPAPTPQVPAGGRRPHWLQAVLGELYFIGVAVTLVSVGWDFNALPLYKGLLISVGLALVARALLPRSATQPASAA